MLPIITVDGTAASGKSSCAAQLAHRLAVPHLNTGLIFRGVAWLVKRDNISISDIAAMSEMAENMEFRFIDGSSCSINDNILGEKELYAADVGDYTRYVTPLPRVRAVYEALIKDVDRAVIEGRDVGHVVGGAYLKFYVQADERVRVARRVAQLRKLGDQTPVEEVTEQVRLRDDVERQRGVRPASQALILDTTSLSLDQTVDLMVVEHEKRYSAFFPVDPSPSAEV